MWKKRWPKTDRRFRSFSFSLYQTRPNHTKPVNVKEGPADSKRKKMIKNGLLVQKLAFLARLTLTYPTKQYQTFCSDLSRSCQWRRKKDDLKQTVGSEVGVLGYFNHTIPYQTFLNVLGPWPPSASRGRIRSGQHRVNGVGSKYILRIRALRAGIRGLQKISYLLTQPTHTEVWSSPLDVWLRNIPWEKWTI